MKKIVFLIIAVVLIAANCKTIDKEKAGGKEIIVVNYHPRTSIFTAFSATAEDCLADLKAEGATKVTQLWGQSKNSAFRPLSASSTNVEACHAIGSK